ncbi:ABC transporter permease DevC [Synechococcus sp. MU1625]|jgi:putative ABC transport system permease protein|uniref:ABC transporter permease DevC n=1 Tax=Synechococcus sp. MU1625 TaxID=2508347 RepID=UPI001CF920D1|nr:ABC transporter permease DevC [Synechococcus sp. MU1625]MCB4400646.1 FtsX-like permease family protein [Synechococcus sp. MU1625]
MSRSNILNDLPLAWLQLKRQPVKYLVAIAGIGFAALLMYMQIGFQSGLLTSSTTFYAALDADLVLISPKTVSSGSFSQFPQSQLFRANGYEDVDTVVPMYVTNIVAQKLGGQKPTSLRVIGYDPDVTALTVEAINEQSTNLKTAGYALFDTEGNSRTGPVSQAIQENGYQFLTLYNLSQTFRTVGLFGLGSTFAADSNIVTSAGTAIQLADQLNFGEISLGLIKVKNKKSIPQLQRNLRELYGGEIQVLTKDELIAQEQNYWNTSSSFGVVFGFGTFMGVIVGGVMVYQVLYTDVTDHLKEYATLKAMGFSNQFILGIVIQEAILLGVSSFIPSTLVSAGMYAFLTSASGISIQMTHQKIGLVGALTVGICAASAAIAVNKLRDADPASVF